jgi:hypothetical protein
VVAGRAPVLDFNFAVNASIHKMPALYNFTFNQNRSIIDLKDSYGSARKETQTA